MEVNELMEQLKAVMAAKPHLIAKLKEEIAAKQEQLAMLGEVSEPSKRKGRPRGSKNVPKPAPTA